MVTVPASKPEVKLAITARGPACADVASAAASAAVRMKYRKRPKFIRLLPYGGPWRHQPGAAGCRTHPALRPRRRVADPETAHQIGRAQGRGAVACFSFGPAARRPVSTDVARRSGLLAGAGGSSSPARP